MPHHMKLTTLTAIRRVLSCLLLFSLSVLGKSSSAKLELWHVEPPFWFTEMANPEVQVLIHAKDVGKYNVEIDAQGIRYNNSTKVENPNYLFVNLTVLPACKAGKFDIVLKNGKHTHRVAYELKARNEAQKKLMGLTPADNMYLIMPDRFANGNEKNDVVKGMNEMTINRDSLFYRHGGDLQGIMQHLDYLEDMGITALWINPVLENDQPQWSYHGYAATDLYRVDKRLGDNDLYRELAQEAHKRGIKMVMDIIHNHVGNECWFVRDLPAADWIHQFPKFTKTTYRATTLLDPYASEYDKKIMTDGWFDRHMPDLNQDNALLAKYLIQNNIWWVEYIGIDALRLDTYAYSSEDFRQKWVAAVLAEYPRLSIFGETWVQGLPTQIYFHGHTHVQTPFKSQLTGLTDFQLYYAANAAFNEPFGWNEGVMRLYETLAGDYLYSDPNGNVTFLDNHDLSRYFSVVGERLDKFKLGITFLFTTRGIPCLYYGTEILMKNFANPDGLVRLDFPGGWPADKSNKFNKTDRTSAENEAFEYIRSLCQWRKKSTVITNGRLMQYVPEKGIYTYFRYTDKEAVMVVINSNDTQQTLETERFVERLAGYKSAQNILTKEKINNLNKLNLPPTSALVLELKR